MGYLKGKKQLNDFRPAFLGKRLLRGHSGTEQKQIQEYIKHQLEEDQIADQMSLKEFIDPFTGSKNTKA